jgi:hypothetical protein
VAERPGPRSQLLTGWDLNGDPGSRAGHEDDICAGLDVTERAQLSEPLERMAARQGLAAGVHPGYRQPGQRRGGSLPPTAAD